MIAAIHEIKRALSGRRPFVDLKTSGVDEVDNGGKGEDYYKNLVSKALSQEVSRQLNTSRGDPSPGDQFLLTRLYCVA